MRGARPQFLAAKWEEKLLLLKAFQAEAGHCNIPSNDPVWRGLWSWAYIQRQKREEGSLSQYQIAQLEALGFEWTVQDNWAKHFGGLKSFIDRFGHSRVPRNWNEDPALGAWVARQRFLKTKGKLDPRKEKALKDLSFSWSPREGRWEQQFNLLSEALSAGASHEPLPLDLRTWMTHQRVLKRSGELLPDQIKRLDDIGFDWDPHFTDWLRKYRALGEFSRAHGHSNVPSSHSDQQLGRWDRKQRKCHAEGRLSDEQIRLLQALDFIW